MIAVTFKYICDFAFHRIELPFEIIFKQLYLFFVLIVAIHRHFESRVRLRDLLMNVIKDFYTIVRVVNEVIKSLDLLVVRSDALIDLFEKPFVQWDFLYGWLQEFIHEFPNLRFDFEPFEFAHFVRHHRCSIRCLPRILGITSSSCASVLPKA